MQLEAEFTSEPFHGEGPPPEHAVKARDKAEDAGLSTDFGPLGTLVRGDADTLLDALPAIARAALDGGATRVTLQLRQIGDDTGEPAVEVHSALELHNALARLIGDVERELGAKLDTLDRAAKQRAVRLLKERGAFGLRKSVSTVAEALGVTRFTVYNYLNRDQD
ncbi:helix-turn-helix domain-containing protein [Amycolatopsis regifaucium]|uniref:DNA-binding protein n=1 Tax=Amycolatopsis regifaucium TaxID=546365 RepID=A0A154M7N2_9PSEU|nr:helix-turn-helix domain-containing protein [Amycolatopsis regifaucium]KZB80453.1 DNA-binding protein [Amycolatopsis regifaucium]OKA05423.1 DNA-binding protein [Amycolatopsis regifaucium]